MIDVNIVNKNSIWEIINSIGTLLAVIVALMLPYIQRRKIIEVTLVYPTDEFAKGFNIHIHIINKGYVPVIFTGLCMQIKENNKIGHRNDFNIITVMPATSFEFNFLTNDRRNFIKKVKRIYITDAQGKKWNISKKEIKRCIKYLDNFKGFTAKLYEKNKR